MIIIECARSRLEASFALLVLYVLRDAAAEFANCATGVGWSE